MGMMGNEERKALDRRIQGCTISADEIKWLFKGDWCETDMDEKIGVLTVHIYVSEIHYTRLDKKLTFSYPCEKWESGEWVVRITQAEFDYIETLALLGKGYYIFDRNEELRKGEKK